MSGQNRREDLPDLKDEHNNVTTDFKKILDLLSLDFDKNHSNDIGSIGQGWERYIKNNIPTLKKEKELRNSMTF